MRKRPVQIDREILGGTPCFKGTRVPIQNLYDHLMENGTIDAFVDDFPTVERQQVLDVLELANSDCVRHAIVTE